MAFANASIRLAAHECFMQYDALGCFPLLQPFRIGVFGASRKRCKNEIERFVRNGLQRSRRAPGAVGGSAGSLRMNPRQRFRSDEKSRKSKRTAFLNL